MNPRIYLDMDGVLADFFHGSLQWHGRSLHFPDARWNFMEQVGMANDAAFWEPISNVEFWAGLPVLESGRQLVESLACSIGIERIGILSNGGCPGSTDGKKAWLRRHFPELEKNALFGVAKHFAAAPCKILVDDHEDNVDAFREHKGRAVLVPAPWNSLKPLTCEQGRYRAEWVAKHVLHEWKAIIS